MTEPAEKTLSEVVQTALDEHFATVGGGFTQSIVGMVSFVNSNGEVMNLMIEPQEQPTSITLGLIRFLDIWSDIYARQQIIQGLSGGDEEDD